MRWIGKEKEDRVKIKNFEDQLTHWNGTEKQQHQNILLLPFYFLIFYFYSFYVFLSGILNTIPLYIHCIFLYEKKSEEKDIAFRSSAIIRLFLWFPLNCCLHSINTKLLKLVLAKTRNYYMACDAFDACECWTKFSFI